MAEWKINYNREFVLSPMTPWVHNRVDDGEGGPAVYDPPRPLPIPGKGYPQFVITVDRFPFTFASLYEVDEAIRVLDQPELPVAQPTPGKNLTVYRKLDPFGAKTKHWTTRLPKNMQGSARRRKIVWELKHGRDAIKKALGAAGVERAYGRNPEEPRTMNQEP